ncbi:hypothetical protein QYF61_020959 [Mycteria americana]|uniref:Uncharacterized protein n=1 Tax=Mycteria americana TaxID=33587 RepID=A0AAN7NXS3_MYCAM|nr:hypothetical protein QYF61_020959 [Mycteria americana]
MGYARQQPELGKVARLGKRRHVRNTPLPIRLAKVSINPGGLTERVALAVASHGCPPLLPDLPRLSPAAVATAEPRACAPRRRDAGKGAGWPASGE